MLDDLDCAELLMRIGRVAEQYGWGVVAYCLMPNHYHLVIDIDERGMSRGLCRLNTGYATEFNDRHGRINHLFGHRYGSNRIDGDDRLINACRYVLLNPVRGGLVRRPEDYRWSSYRATIGVTAPEIPLALDQLLGSFHPNPRRAMELLADFVGFAHPDLSTMARTALAGGSLRNGRRAKP